MGRRIDVESENNLRTLRVSRGLTQAQLAEASGLTRQAVNGIELGKYVPNALVALALARALVCRVEDIFSSAVDATIDAESAKGRIVAGRVGSRRTLHSLEAAASIGAGFVASDGFADAYNTRLSVSPELLDRTAFVAGCDPALPILQGLVARADPTVRITLLHASSASALSLLGEGRVNVAGCHLPEDGGHGNVPAASEALTGLGGLVLTYARWEQGLAVAPGNPKRIRQVADLAQSGVRIINRDSGSGSRASLDGWLAEAGVPVDRVGGYDTAAGSHIAVAMAVASGAADAGVTLRAVAEAYELGFVPLGDVRFDLVIPRAELSHPAVAVLIDVLGSVTLREDLARLPGYGVSETGFTQAVLEAA